MQSIQTTAIIFLLFLFSSIVNAASSFKVIESDASTFHVKINLEQPELRSKNNQQYAVYDNAYYLVDDEGYYIPKLTRLINLSSDTEPFIKIINKVSSKISVPHYLIAGQPSEITAVKDQIVTVQHLGKFNGAPLYALDIFPVRYHSQDHSLEYITEIEVVVKSSITNKSHQLHVTEQKLSSNSFIKQAILNSGNLFLESNLESIATSKSEESQVSFFSNYSDLYKLSVAEDGIYKISYEDLEDIGYPLETVNPLYLHLFNQNTEVPIYFVGAEDGTFDKEDYFEFWGTKNEQTLIDQFPDVYTDPFSDRNIYWLGTGQAPGYRMSEESGRLTGSGSGYIFQPYAYTEKLHFEKDNHYERFGHTSSGVGRPSHEIDHWYFDSGISAPEGIAYEFYVPHPFESGSNVVLKTALRGRSYYNNSTNRLLGHQVDIKLRGKNDVSKLVGRITPAQRWRDQELRFISNADSSVKLSQTILENGINRLEVDMFQTGVTDIVLMNWFEIEYLRKYRAHDNYIKFHVDREFFNNSYVNLGDIIQINVDGFTSKDISLYKLGVSKIVNSKIGTVENDQLRSIGISFQDQIYDPDIQYIALTDDAKKKPVSIDAYRPWDGQSAEETLLNLSRPIDYLIITHNLFYENALQLKALKNAQGMQAEVVTVENIYDLFNYGIKSPLAIKDFIRFVVQHWDRTDDLPYVVFVGKASYDYKGRYTKGADLVPTFMYQTEKYGAASSDYWYALLDEDDYIPDVIVARIPASTNQELVNYIDKIKNYNLDQNSTDEWQNNALFISGNDAGSGDKEYLTNDPIFRAQNMRLLNMQLPKGHFSHRLNTVKDENISGYDPNFGSTTDLIEYFDDGLTFINFLGHGGGGIWADVNLLNLSDIDRLNNGYKLPFIASMTCFTGAFENPSRLGLAEKLILSEQKGAIAVLAASGVGWKYNDFAIEWSLFEFLWNRNLTFGQAINLMKTYYLANAVYVTEKGEFGTFSHSWLKHTMVSQYNLLGDPSLKLNQAKYELTVVPTNLSPAAGDTISISITSAELSSGSGHLQIVSESDSLVSETYFSFAQNYNYSFPIPQEAAGNQYSVNVFVSDGAQTARGSAQIKVERAVVKSIAFDPVAPMVNQAIHFTITSESHFPIIKMELTNFRPAHYSYGDGTRILMLAQNDTLFKSVQPYSGFSSGGLKYFDVYITDNQGNDIVQRRVPVTILDNRPDILIIPGSLTYAGTTGLKLKFDVRNESDSALTNVKINCYDQAGIELGTTFAVSEVDLAGHEQKSVSVAYDTSGVAAKRIFKIEIDPDDEIAERDENNNLIQTELMTDHFYVERELGTSRFGQTNDTIQILNQWDYFIPANSLPVSGVIQFSKHNLSEFFRSQAQSGLKYVPIVAASDTSAIELIYPEQLENATNEITLSAQIELNGYSIEELDNISLFRYDAFLNLWLNVGRDSLVNDRFYGSVSHSGRYALFDAGDDQEPTIEVTANGRPLINDMLLVRKPLISLLLQDENGVNFTNSLNVRIDDISLILDGKPQVQNEVSIPDSLQNARAIAITANPSLEAGSHTLTIEVADVNGNLAKAESQFVVTGDFFLEVHGNYPNPFSDETIIAYTVTSDNDMDDFSIRIYTTSGRLIRKTMLPWDESIENDNIFSNNYHELVWDGTDDDGNQVANGVYFMVISGKFKGKTIKETLKIARLK